jgi:neuromedin U receptor 1
MFVSLQIKRRFLDFAFEISGFIFFVGPMILICVLYILISIKLKSTKLIRRNSSEQNQSIINNQAYVIRMLVAVVATFFICWAPFHMQRLMAVYGSLFSHSISVWFHRIYAALTYVSGVLYFLSTCINPVLYSLMSNKFRRAFKVLASNFHL